MAMKYLLLAAFVFVSITSYSQVYRYRTFRANSFWLADTANRDNWYDASYIITQDFNKNEIRLYVPDELIFPWYDIKEKKVGPKDGSHILYSYEFFVLDETGGKMKILVNRMTKEENYELMIIVKFANQVFVFMANAIK